MDKKYFKELVETFLHMKTADQMVDFLYGILTPRELEELSTRLQIIKQLRKGVRQQTIAKNLRVGIATVTRGSRELKIGHFKYV